MSNILAGCQEGKATPKLTEVKCPQCGDVIELFVRMGGGVNETGRTVGDGACEKCGYAVPEGSSISEFEPY